MEEEIIDYPDDKDEPNEEDIIDLESELESEEDVDEMEEDFDEEESA